MKGRRTALGAGIAVAVALVVPGAAGAATVTIGSPLTSPFTNNPSGAIGTSAMIAGPNLASPVDGTVVNWHTQNFSGTLKLRVLNVGQGLNTTAVASSQSVSLNGGAVDTPVSVPIHKGEIVGFDNTSPSDSADVVMNPGYNSAFWTTLPDNGSPQAPLGTLNIEFAYNATVRYCLVPGVKGKKLDAARQTLANAGCALGTAIKKNAKKKLKGPKVVASQSVPAGTSLADQAPVNVLVKVKPKRNKKK